MPDPHPHHYPVPQIGIVMTDFLVREGKGGTVKSQMHNILYLFNQNNARPCRLRKACYMLSIYCST